MNTAGSGVLPVQIGQVLHIGAGYGADLPGYRAEGARAITLVEPDPDALSVLYDTARDYPDVAIIGSAVSARAGAGVLHRFSFGDLNSLRRPTGLWQIFPGLDELSRESVSVIDAVTLVDQLLLAEDGDHMLVVEAPGEGFDILAALHAADRLGRFTWVRVQDGRASLYEGAGDIASIAELLEKAGFSHPVLHDDSDPDRPVLTAHFDRLGALRAALAAQQDQNADIKAAQARAIAKLDDAQTTLAHHEAGLAELHDRLTVEQTAHAEAATARQTAEAGLAELRDRLTVEQTAHAEAATARQTAEAELAELRDRLTVEQTAHAEAATARQTAEAGLAELRDRLTAEQTAHAEAATARQTAEAGLAELRDRLTAEQTARAQDAADHANKEAELVKYQDALARVESNLSEQSEELSSEHAARSAEASKRQEAETALATARASLAEAETALATRAQEAEQAIAHEAQLHETCANLQKQLVEAQAAEAAKDTRLSELEQSLAARAQELQELENARAGFAEKETQLRDEAKTLRQCLKTAESSIKKEADDARIAMRTQALTQADLVQLQHRFGVLRAEKDRQDALLLKVTQRLADAADYLKTLQLPGDAPNLAVNVALAEQTSDATARDAPARTRAKTRKGGSKKAESGKRKT